MACNPDKMEVDHLCSCFHSITLMLCKHVNNVCKTAFFSFSNIGRIGKYLDHDICLLQYLKLSFMGTDHLQPGLLDFGMHYR